jgi:hypothetical protein
MFPVTDFDRRGVERFKRETEQKLRGLRCPEHRQSPRLRFHGTSLRDITISLSGCCEQIMHLANARIGSAPESREPAHSNSGQ